MTFIQHQKIVFGPVRSRRMGLSLGINLLPVDGKLCSFDCIYCECGLNEDNITKSKLPSVDVVCRAIEEKLISLSESNITPDVITFAGNGEPTLHPNFKEIIEKTIFLRDNYLPEVKIAVLSNGTNVENPNVFEALSKVDNNILKLDSAIESTVKLINQPNSSKYRVKDIIRLYEKFRGKVIIQTMFLRGFYKNAILDNTSEEEVSAWIDAIKEIIPKMVMLYTIDRKTPIFTLKKVSLEEMNAIAERVNLLGIKTIVAG